jgi:hypothetical protein
VKRLSIKNVLNDQQSEIWNKNIKGKYCVKKTLEKE